MPHTPGPWTVDGQTLPQNLQISSPDGIVTVIDSEAFADTIEANARLIAAAPDLLAVLRDLSDAYQKHFDAMPVAWQTYDNMVSAAIARATYTLKD
jgi:hypothetical protein